MEHPKNNPAYPDRLMLRKVFAVKKHSAFYGLIGFLCQPLKDFKRPGIPVMIGIFLTIQTTDHEQQHHDAGQYHRNGFCHDQHDLADCRPIPGKVFFVCKHCKKIARRDGKFVEIRRQKNSPLQHARILRDRRRKRIVCSKQLAKIESDGESEIFACLAEACI